MATISGKALGVKLCEIFGQDPARVQSITITVETGAVAHATVERQVTDVEAREVVSLFSNYKLELVSEFRKVHPQLAQADGTVPPADDEWSKRAQDALAAEEAKHE